MVERIYEREKLYKEVWAVYLSFFSHSPSINSIHLLQVYNQESITLLVSSTIFRLEQGAIRYSLLFQ